MSFPSCISKNILALASLIIIGFLIAVSVRADNLAPKLSTAPANATSLIAPTSYAVYQRSATNTASIPIAGRAEQSVGIVEAKATLMPPYREGVDGKSGEFIAIAKPNGREFRSSLEVSAGGWYSIAVRLKDTDGHIITETKIDKVGVGEVFVAAGHSFCSNFNGEHPSKATDDRVATCVDWKDKPPVPLAFRHCDDPLRPGDANHASPWPPVGDVLVSRLHVPVLFICTGMGGTTVEGWRKGAEDPNAKVRGYGACRLTLQSITPYTGLRAIIWLGNENDLSGGPTAEVFSDNLRQIIARTRIDSGYPDLPWLIAFDAYDPGVIKKLGPETKLRHKERLDRGTEMVLQTVPHTYDGPQTDDLGPEFRKADGDHFNEAGLHELSLRFARKITQAFFPEPVPAPKLPKLP